MSAPHLTVLPQPRNSWVVPLLVALLAATLWGMCFRFPVSWTITGIGEADKLFLDLRNILSAGEVAQQGLDPYRSNPLDPYHRLHGYTDWLLVPGALGLTLRDTLWIGTLLIGAVLVAAVLFVRPKNWREGGVLLLFLVSPPLLFAVNRANHDVLVFVIMCGALACFRREHGPWRALGLVLLGISAALKYFPLAAAIILLDARSRRELLGWGALYGLVLLLAWPALARGLLNAAQHTPAPSWLYAFGAPVVFRDFDLPVPTGWLLAGFIAFTGAVGWPLLKAGPSPRPEGLAATLDREFACGAIMVAGCFVHGTSYSYKLIFAWWLLPWLLRAILTGTENRWRQATLGLLLATLWLEGGLAILINTAVFAAILPTPHAVVLLKITLVAGQLLNFVFVLCLWRTVLRYLIGQGLRLARPAEPLPGAVLPGKVVSLQ
jgi:hypothetical protein